MKLIHLSGLERYLKTSKNSNIILSWNLNNNYFKHFKKGNFLCFKSLAKK